MSSCKFTSFGLCVKTKLLHNGMTQRELEKEVSAATGLFVDSSYMNKILTGRRSAPKSVQTIREILELPESDQTSA